MFPSKVIWPLFFGLNGQELDYQFDFWPFFWPYLLTYNSKWKIWIHFKYLQFKSFSMVLKTLDLDNIYTLHFCHINSWHSKTPNSQSQSSFKKCFLFIPLMCLSLFFTLFVSWFIFSLPCPSQVVTSPRLVLQHIVWWFIFIKKTHSLLYNVKFIIFYDTTN
jgi:hypothetical protein